LCGRQLLLVVGDEVDDDLWQWLRRRRVDDHSVRVVMAMLATWNAGRRWHLLPLIRRQERHMRQKWWLRWQRRNVLCHHVREGNGLVLVGKDHVFVGLGCLQDLLEEGVLVVAGCDDYMVLRGQIPGAR
jgi:hypothetical protein